MALPNGCGNKERDMQKDFHFYTIYSLCRSAGFSPESAHIVAYSSQHTDDAKHKHVLKFQDGDEFHQVLTAHRFLTLDLFELKEVFDDKTCLEVWIPFHFLPGNIGTDDLSRMITRADSEVAHRLIEHFLNDDKKPFLLHYFGILLHVYADTWSHQNFIGVLSDLNDVRSVEVEDYIDLIPNILECVVPKLGHGQAGSLPDEPFRVWEYRDAKNRKIGPIHNHKRALEAAKKCYQLMERVLKKYPEFKQKPHLDWSEVDSQFSIKGSVDNRISYWKHAINQEKFLYPQKKYHSYLTYDDREWFKEAVTIKSEKRGEKIFEKNPGFEKSNWKFFHEAAKYHKEILLGDILPELNLNISKLAFGRN